MPEPELVSKGCAKCKSKNIKKYVTLKSPTKTRPQVFPFCRKCYKTLDLKI